MCTDIYMNINVKISMYILLFIFISSWSASKFIFMPQTTKCDTSKFTSATLLLHIRNGNILYDS